MENLLQQLTNGEEGGGTEEPDPTLPEGWDPDRVTAEVSDDGVTVPVPIGFTASEATGEHSVNDGFVIYQGTDPVNDENVYNAQRSRNQFVWIPVDEESLGEMYATTAGQNLSQSTLGEAVTTTDVYSKLRGRDGDSYGSGKPNTTSAREPDITTNTSTGDASTTSGRGLDEIKNTLKIPGSSNAEILKNFAQSLVDEYTATYTSIKKYGGFYVGRYEITEDTTTPTVQKDKAVLTASSSQAGNWYGLKNACNNLVSTNSAQTTMIYGNQWDEIMDWLMDTGDKTDSEINTNSSTWGNYSDSSEDAAVSGAGDAQDSGFSDYWSANNIYDLAGNYREYTQEAFNTNYRMYRGGSYTTSGSSYPASDRLSTSAYTSSNGYSTRAAMYIVTGENSGGTEDQKEQAVISAPSSLTLSVGQEGRVSIAISKGDGVANFEIVGNQGVISSLSKKNDITVGFTGLSAGQTTIKVSMDGTENYAAAEPKYVQITVTE